MKTTTWKSICKCGEPVYYYPVKLLLEGDNPSIDVVISKLKLLDRNYHISIKCCGGYESTIDYRFPKDFTQFI